MLDARRVWVVRRRETEHHFYLGRIEPLEMRHTHTHKDKDTDGSSGSKRYSVFMEFSTFECLKISEKQLHLKRYSLRFHLVLMLHNSKN